MGKYAFYQSQITTSPKTQCNRLECAAFNSLFKPEFLHWNLFLICTSTQENWNPRMRFASAANCPKWLPTSNHPALNLPPPQSHLKVTQVWKFIGKCQCVIIMCLTTITFAEFTHKTTLYLLDLCHTHINLYNTNKHLFYKKLEQNFHKKGYPFTLDKIRKKVGNLLTTYKRNKARLTSTGDTKISWEYYMVSVAFSIITRLHQCCWIQILFPFDSSKSRTVNEKAIMKMGTNNFTFYFRK